MILRDPSDVEPLTFDFSDDVPGDEILTATASAAPGIDVGSVQVDGLEVQVWLSGGDPGRSYRVVATITTLGERRIQRSKSVLIRQQ